MTVIMALANNWYAALACTRFTAASREEINLAEYKYVFLFFF